MSRLIVSHEISLDATSLVIRLRRRVIEDNRRAEG